MQYLEITVKTFALSANCCFYIIFGKIIMQKFVLNNNINLFAIDFIF